MAQAPKVTQRVPPGPSPEALAAFYRQRSEALHRNTTTTEDQAMQQQQQQSPAQQQQRSWFQTLMHALGAEGY